MFLLPKVLAYTILCSLSRPVESCQFLAILEEELPDLILSSGVVVLLTGTHCLCHRTAMPTDIPCFHCVPDTGSDCNWSRRYAPSPMQLISTSLDTVGFDRPRSRQCSLWHAAEQGGEYRRHYTVCLRGDYPGSGLYILLHKSVYGFCDTPGLTGEARSKNGQHGSPTRREDDRTKQWMLCFEVMR